MLRVGSWGGDIRGAGLGRLMAVEGKVLRRDREGGREGRRERGKEKRNGC